MHPPPSTPTPRRFLLPKRGTQQPSSSQTPTSAAAGAPAGTPRFQSTPRFGGGGSSVVKPLGRRALSQEIEDVDDAGYVQEEERVLSSSAGDAEERIVSSSYGDEQERVVSSSFGDEQEKRVERGKVALGDDIVEADAEDLTGWIEGEVVLGSESPEQRRVKRRRLSVDEHMSSSPSPPPEALPATLSDEEQSGGEDAEVSRTWSASDEEDIDPTGRDVPALHQPTFRPAPRFKPTEGESAAAEGMLPAAFSPQRRGAKYLAGGLAAELQGWLSDVKRWDEDGGGSALEERFSIDVSEVRNESGRMYLVTSRGDDGRFILAGEGRLTGLGRRAVVREGVRVDVEGPVWEVELDGNRWLVCCEWWVA